MILRDVRSYTCLTHFPVSLREMAGKSITLMDGRLHLYRRPNSRFWRCSTYLLGRNFRVSTEQESIPLAKEFAVEWYMEVYAAAKRRERGETVPAPTHLRGGHPDIIDRRRRPIASGPTFKQAADAFVKEYAISVQGERNESYVAQKEQTIRVHLMPFFGTKALNEITAGLVQDYRVHRQTSRKIGKGRCADLPAAPPPGDRLPSSDTETGTARTACRPPGYVRAYKASGKIIHRAWFSPEEYEALHQAIADKAENSPKEHWRSHWELLLDYVLIMANTGLRVDEAANLQYRDISIVTDDQTKKRILEIEVRGKRGVGYCKSMPNAVFPFERLRERVTRQRGGVAPLPTDPVFGKVKRGLFNTILTKLDLKHDRDGQVRTAGSLRPPISVSA